MKYLISISCLLLLISLFFVQKNLPTATIAELKTSDEVIRTTEKSEKEVICLPLSEGKKVFHINHIWVVNEYESGKIITASRQDTLLAEALPKGTPCPGSIVEVTMR